MLLSVALGLFARPGWGEEPRSLRVVSLAPSTTEILFALGLDREIVGVSRLCQYPPRAVSKPKIGDFSNPSLERILSLKPDYVFCTGIEQARVAEKLKQLGCPVVVSSPENFGELFDSITGIGRRVGREREAAELIAGMKAKIDRVSDRSRSRGEGVRPRVFVEIWHSPLMTAGNGSFIDELITLAGGQNVAGDIGKAYGNISPEQVIRRDPEVIVLTYMEGKGSVDPVKKRWGWSAVSAVRNGRVYGDIDPALLLIPGPRLADGLIELQKRIAP
ncbi:MAG TPA: cobalamin-binding protein [Elusimicrobiota bacterium]|nr:cobalamin-binding protein [Elusimicrobiota bacterium]